VKQSGAIRQVIGMGTPAAALPVLHVVPSAGLPRPGWLAAQCDRLFAATSLVPTLPLLDVRAFDWTCALRRHWADLDGESRDVASGRPVCLDSHPLTWKTASAIPGFVSARFERIEPGVHATARPRAGRALLTCHLGLQIPRAGDLRMRVGGRMVRWAEGETLLFDETQADARWNDGMVAGLVLAVRLRRPLRQPGRWLADRLLARA
jgi:aspartyl/asparaginyl beta-hydroxylase (cupin superfamily)